MLKTNNYAKVKLLEIDELIKTLNILEEHRTPSWGKMNASQMIVHCQQFIDLYLGKIKVPFYYNFAGMTFGWLFFRYITSINPNKTPKNLPTASQLKIKEKKIDFTIEKKKLIEKLYLIKQLNKTIKNPIYGNLSASKTKFLIKHHCMHHFYQFNLL